MSRARQLYIVPSMVVLVGSSMMLGGCKAQQEMRQQIADQDTRVMTLEKRVSQMDSQTKGLPGEVETLRRSLNNANETLAKLQDAENRREQREAQEAQAKAAAAARPAAGKKPLPKKRHK